MLKLAFRIIAAADRWLANAAERQEASAYSQVALVAHREGAVDVLLQDLRAASCRKSRRKCRIAVAMVIQGRHIVVPLAAASDALAFG